jgi:hypothetical protein
MVLNNPNVTLTAPTTRFLIGARTTDFRKCWAGFLK